MYQKHILIEDVIQSHISNSISALFTLFSKTEIINLNDVYFNKMLVVLSIINE